VKIQEVNSDTGIELLHTSDIKDLGLADKYEYEYWSIFVFIFKDFGLNLFIFMFMDWLCLNMNIFMSGNGSNRLYINFNSIKALCFDRNNVPQFAKVETVWIFSIFCLDYRK
jgi:hypothetical protein